MIILALTVLAQAAAPGSSFERYRASLEGHRDCVVGAAVRLEVSGEGAGDIADTALLQCRAAAAEVEAATRAHNRDPVMAERLIQNGRADDTLRRVAIATVVEIRTRRAEQARTPE
jgi:hypothetical protein